MPIDSVSCGAKATQAVGVGPTAGVMTLPLPSVTAGEPAEASYLATPKVPLALKLRLLVTA